MLYEIFKYRPDNTKYRETSLLADNDTLVGIEIEVEGDVRLRNKQLAYWDEVEDGSLRNGREFVTTGAGIAGANVIAAINEITTYLRTTNHQFSDRCSVHVHMDARKLTRQQIMAMAIVYAYFEEVLFYVAGEWRSANIFCQSFARSNMANIVTSFGVSDEATYAIARNTGRYASFNVNAVSKHGTIEIRCHEGTASKRRLIGWVNLLLSLRKYAISKDIDELFKDILYNGGLDIQQVFGKYGNGLQEIPEFYERIKTGRTNVLDIYLNWQKAKETA